MKINGKYQHFTIDTGSPVTIMPNNPELFDQKDIQLLKEIYQHVNKNKLNSWGKYGQTMNTMAKLQKHQYSLHKETTSHHFWV